MPERSGQALSFLHRAQPPEVARWSCRVDDNALPEFSTTRATMRDSARNSRFDRPQNTLSLSFTRCGARSTTSFSARGVSRSSTPRLWAASLLPAVREDSRR